MNPHERSKFTIDDKIAAKEIMIYHYAGHRRVFQGSVLLRNVPGALASASAKLAQCGANLVATSSSNTSNSDFAEWAFFAEAGEKWPGLKRTQEILDECPGVVKSVLREGNDGMVIDDLHYPLRLNTGEQAMVISRRTFRDMFNRVLTVFGSGGRVIIYELGLAAGIEDYAHFARILGNRNLQQRISDLVSLYTAHGWGKVERAGYSLRPFCGALKVYDNFECAGISAGKPNSDFLRGHIEGFIQTLTGESIECKETKCVSVGDAYCQFECSEGLLLPRTPTPWKSEVWESLNPKSLK